MRAGFTDDYPLEDFFVYSLGKYSIGSSEITLPIGGEGKQYFSSSNFSYDIAPGSYSPVFIDQLAQSISSNFGFKVAYVDNTCFIPTISALDLNIDLNTSFNPNTARCLSMFDFIYANSSYNDNHWNLTYGAKSFIMAHVLANEFPINRKDVIIPANTIVLANKSYNVISSFNISNAGSFILKSGSTASLKAGSSVTLNPGFEMELGAILETIVSTDLCQSDVAYLPNYVSRLKSGYNSILINNTYDCTNYRQMSTYKNDSIVFNCGLTNITSNIDSVLDNNISIYPNPASTNITISFTNEIPLSYTSIKVFDSMNNLVFEQSTVNSIIININISNYPVGLITIQFNINNGAYIYTRKVVKQ